MNSNVSRLWSGSRLAVALAIGVGLVIGLGVAGCAVTADESAASEPAEPMTGATAQAGLVPEANLMFVFQCFTPDGGPIGFPKSPLSACQAACPAPNHCVICTLQRGAVECPEP